MTNGGNERGLDDPKAYEQTDISTTDGQNYVLSQLKGITPKARLSLQVAGDCGPQALALLQARCPGFKLRIEGKSLLILVISHNNDCKPPQL